MFILILRTRNGTMHLKSAGTFRKKGISTGYVHHPENALAIRDVEYPSLLSDNPEQRVFDDMLRCRVHKNKFITDSTTEKTNMREVGTTNVSLVCHSPIPATTLGAPLIMMPAHTMILHAGYWSFP
ncbi:hypothetical protein TNCV_4195231 [Trichonephila clavipes]|nr:hypothetical protein TNCV_4195231 [Trichonephila clavipes]